MPYSTIKDIIKVIPEDSIIQLTDDVNAGAVDTARVDEAIAQADDEIDTYLASQYSVPLSAPAPAIIRGISCDIAIYKMYKRRMEEIPDTRQTSYDNALSVLKEIRDGKMSLPIDTASTGSFATGVLETSHFDTPATISGLEL